MPVRYQIDPRHRTIRTQCIGQVTLAEVIDHFRTLAQDPRCPDHLDVFLDLSQMNSLPEGREISAVITELKRVRSKVRFDACAILVSGDAQFGMMRVFEVQGEQFFRLIRTFRIAAEAEAWLTSQQSLAAREQAADT